MSSWGPTQSQEPWSAFCKDSLFASHHASDHLIVLVLVVTTCSRMAGGHACVRVCVSVCVCVCACVCMCVCGRALTCCVTNPATEVCWHIQADWVCCIRNAQIHACSPCRKTSRCVGLAHTLVSSCAAGSTMLSTWYDLYALMTC